MLTLSQYIGFTPAMVLFGVFFAAPMVLIVVYSFWTQDGLQHRLPLDVRELPVDLQHSGLHRHVPDDAVDDGGSDVR